MTTFEKARYAAFALLVGVGALVHSATTKANTMCEQYCGDGICQSWGCANSGCSSPGDGCFEHSKSCPADCS
jgi:hypothetical protein